MDYLSRLIAGTGRTQTPPKAATPQQRLDRFKRTYGVIKSCDQHQRLVQPGPLVEQLAQHFQTLSDLLREELRAPSPYPCLAYAASTRVYGPIARAASLCRDERIIARAVDIFSTLIDSEIDGFLTERAFARAIMRFSMRILDMSLDHVGSGTEAALTEVLFNIAAKIRSDPDVLDVWFSPSRARDEEEQIREKKSFVGVTQKDDFPLCYLFIDRVHHEGKIGDFARTGLLYIFEAASQSAALDSWIVASDLPTLMASALGALYSQLSRELSLAQEAKDLPPLLVMSDYADIYHNPDVETISSESHKAHMSTFLSDLTFWQDVLDHCRSADVKQTLLDHFQILFLQQLLYPSLLQSSDTDGGSSVAVMTYLTSILQTLTDEDLSNMLLSYLLGSKPEASLQMARRSSSPSVMRRRSSLMATNMPSEGADNLEPSLFNLTDLIHNGLQSSNSQTNFAALKLFTTIVVLQPSHAMSSLIRFEYTLHEAVARNVGSVHVEVDALMQLAISIAGNQGVDDAFEGISHDVRKNLDANILQQAQSAHAIDSRNNSVVLTELDTKVPQRTLELGETGLRALIGLLGTLLTNSVDTNLALTECLLALCMDARVDISGLLAYVPGSQANDAEHTTSLLKPVWLDEDEANALRAVAAASTHARLPTSKPVIVTSLNHLSEQLDKLRSSISRFDALLAKRKSILQGTKEADDLFTTPLKTNRRPLPKRVATQSQSRHGSPMTTPSRIRHGRQTSVASMVTPTSPLRRGSSANRGRQLSQNILHASSPTSSVSRAHASASHSRMGNPLSPVRGLNHNVFRPPPPEPSMSLSPPRMPSLSSPQRPQSQDQETITSPQRAGSFLQPATPIRSPLSSRPSTADPDAPGQSFEDVARAQATDAETLAMAITFDAVGNVLTIGDSNEVERSYQTTGLASNTPLTRGGSPYSLPQIAIASRSESQQRGRLADLPHRLVVHAKHTSEASDSPWRVDGNSDQAQDQSAATLHALDSSAVTPSQVSDDSQQDSDGDQGRTEQVRNDNRKVTASVSHVLTNAIVLQNFVLELAAVLQLRARVYAGEVSFGSEL